MYDSLAKLHIKYLTEKIKTNIEDVSEDKSICNEEAITQSNDIKTKYPTDKFKVYECGGGGHCFYFVIECAFAANC